MSQAGEDSILFSGGMVGYCMNISSLLKKKKFIKDVQANSKGAEILLKIESSSFHSV